MHHQRHGPLQRQPIGFLHVELLRLLPLRQTPVKGVHQGGRHELHHPDPQAHPGADPPPGSEGDELEVLPPEVDALVPAAGEEPGRVELERVRPRRRVVGDGPDVDEQRRAPGNLVAAHLARLRRHAREGQRRGRVEPERLLDDGLQEAQVGEVGLGDEPGSADHRVELPLGLLEDVRVPDELRQRPLHRAR